MQGNIDPITLTDTGSLVLCEARRTLAGEASNGVDTEELAVMLLGRTFIQILEGEKKALNVHQKQITWNDEASKPQRLFIKII